VRLVASSGEFNGVPVPSPDGRRIAFQRGVRRPLGGYAWDLHVVDAAGGAEQPLTANPWSSQVPSWSPDGRRLAFHADPGGRDQLYVLDLRSGAVTPLAPSAATDDAPAFSPDGGAVAFVSTRDGPRDLYRVDVATGVVTRLTTGLDVWAQPGWSPDGRRIVFSASATGVDEVYVIGADGSALTRLTGQGQESDSGPALVLVALSAHDSVVGLHGWTLERLFAVATGRGPHEIAITADGARAFVANTRGASVSTIDVGRRAAGPTHALGEGADPHDVALTDDGTLWVTVAPQRALLELDAESGRVRARWELPADGGWMVDVGPGDAPVAVAHLEGGGVSLLDRTTRRIVFLPLAAGEIEAVLAPDGQTVWSANMRTDSVTVSSVATRARLASFPGGGRSPVRVLLTPDGRTAVVANAGGTDLVLLDRADPRARTVIPLAQPPKVLAVSGDGRRLYVTHPEPGGVSLIDLAAPRVVRMVPLDGAPDGVAVAR
jgi:Tol biopolymer transport system component